jgi:hypothetical protein
MAQASPAPLPLRAEGPAPEPPRLEPRIGPAARRDAEAAHADRAPPKLEIAIGRITVETPPAAPAPPRTPAAGPRGFASLAAARRGRLR